MSTSPALLVLLGVALGLVVAMVGLGRRRPTVAPPDPRSHAADLDEERRSAAERAVLHTELRRLTGLIDQLGQATTHRFGQLDQSLRSHAESTRHLTDTATRLREALASPNARGQWGERMAEDILRAAGFLEHQQYVRHAVLDGDGSGIPDFTFLLPRGHVLFMDVKFPMAAYLRFLDADTDHERALHRAAFLRDVRLHVRELVRRDYAATDHRPAVDNVLLFVPNESVSAFIHETDPDLVDEAMRQRVLLCSPLTLFAFLGIIRQAFDDFVIEQTSREVLQLLGAFQQQWSKYGDSVDRVKRQLDGLVRSVDELAGTRRRALERPLRQLEALRVERGLPVAETDPGGAGDDNTDDTPAGAAVVGLAGHGLPSFPPPAHAERDRHGAGGQTRWR